MSDEANNGDPGDLNSSLTECGSGLNLFSSGAAASSAFVGGAGGGEEGDGDDKVATPSPCPCPADFLCNLESS